MQTVDLRLNARWIVPIEPEGALDRNALIVDGGRIVALLPAAAADAEFAPREQVDLPRHVLMPGLVNAHAHSAMALLRGIADDVPLKSWLEDHIWPREAAFVSPDFVYDGTRLATAEMLKGGITCCNDMYFYPDASARAYLEAGMRAMLGLPVLDFPTPYAADPDAYLQAGLAVRDACKHQPTLSFALAPHAPYTVGDATWEKIVMYARQLNLAVQTHVAETRHEVAESIARYGMTPLARVHALGATGPAFIAIHGVHLTTEDIELLAVHGGHVVHCPASNLKLGSGIAPLRALVEQGINVALGTDGAASNNRLDILGEARLASLLAKGAAADPAAVPARQVLRMATLNGARALGFDADIGSLVAGKFADVIAVDLGEIGTTPCYDPVSHLVHAADRGAVTDVWIAGRRIVERRQLTTQDEAGIVARARIWQERLE